MIHTKRTDVQNNKGIRITQSAFKKISKQGKQENIRFDVIISVANAMLLHAGQT
jgi:DNA-binding Xre family transcriptional regulator